MTTPAEREVVECTSEIGISVGLVDAIMTSAVVVSGRIKNYDGDIPQPIVEALSDLFTCDSLRYLMSLGGCFTYVPSKDFLEVENGLLKLALERLLARHCDGNEEKFWAEWDLAKTAMEGDSR